MEVLGELVRNLAIILILASLLEMFLPSNNMSRYVQTIVGLFILVTLLNPLLNLINQDWGASLEAWSGQNQGPPLEEILAQGNRLGEADKNRATGQYKEKLAAQVKGVAGLVPGVRVQAATVKLSEQQGVAGGLESIQLTVVLKPDAQAGLGTATKAVTAINPLKTKANTEANAGEVTASSAQIRDLQTTLANLYGLKPDAVEIKEIKEGNGGGR